MADQTISILVKQYNRLKAQAEQREKKLRADIRELENEIAGSWRNVKALGAKLARALDVSGPAGLRRSRGTGKRNRATKARILELQADILDFLRKKGAAVEEPEIQREIAKQNPDFKPSKIKARVLALGKARKIIQTRKGQKGRNRPPAMWKLG